MSTLIGTKVKEAEIWLSRFITQVEQLEGDIDKVVVMYAESRDKSLSYLQHWRDVSDHNIEIYKDPYLPPGERHGAFLTRVKRDLQKLLKESGAKYFLNLDCDLIDIPPETIPHLKDRKKDLIAGMTWIEGRRNPTFFDTYEFRQDGCRFHPFNPPGLNRTEPFSVDSVSTYYLATAKAELAGTYVNPYPHIPFCRDLRDKGYSVWVDPTIGAVHYDLEAIGTPHLPLPIGLSMAPYIDDQGAKWDPAVIGALQFHQAKLNYDVKLAEARDMSYLSSIMFLRMRPLITASYKIAPNDWDWFNYSLRSIYEYVDRIDVVTGPLKKRSHQFASDTDAKGYWDPDNKVRIIDGVWDSKEHIQAKLLEVCQSKWMFNIDIDEVYTAAAMRSIREFCEEHPDGTMVYARPRRFYNFWGDFKHIVWSMNPLSPFGEFAVPHPMLVHRDIPGLNFASFHTTPQDGFGTFFTQQEKSYPGRVTVLDDVEVFHFGNAKELSELEAKRDYYKARGDPNVYEEAFFTGELPMDMIIGKSPPLGEWPRVLRDHPRWNENSRIRVTRKKPSYKFRWVQ